MASLVRETAENVLRIGPEQAMTGPIARGDVATVLNQYRAVSRYDGQQDKTVPSAQPSKREPAAPKAAPVAMAAPIVRADETGIALRSFVETIGV